MCVCVCVCTCVYVCADWRVSRTHTHTHTHTHTRTHTLAHMHSHTHALTESELNNILRKVTDCVYRTTNNLIRLTSEYVNDQSTHTHTHPLHHRLHLAVMSFCMLTQTLSELYAPCMLQCLRMLLLHPHLSRYPPKEDVGCVDPILLLRPGHTVMDERR